MAKPRQDFTLLREQYGFHRRGQFGRYGHFVNLVKLQWPDLQWNPWLERQCEALCDDTTAVLSGNSYVKTVAMTGAGAAGKTFSAGLFALAWWRIEPTVSTVILCSTTKEMLRKRIWEPISRLHLEAFPEVGNLIDSRTKIVASKGDDLHGIFGIAVAGGDTIQAVQHIKGTHAERVLVVIDEAEGTPEAIFEALPNLRKGCQEFILIVLGNSVSRLDPHGMVCQPKNGWKSVTVETDSWLTKGVPRWQVEPGVCLHFDGTKSPNVVAQRTIYPYLYTWEDYKAARETPDYTLSMAYWSHERGFWPPEGMSNRIFTDTMIEKYDAMSRFEFVSQRMPMAFLDPAFGGDDCKLVFGVLGDAFINNEVVLALEVTDSTIIPITADSPHEADYQVARSAIALCKERNIAHRQFGADAVGTGRGAFAIIAGEWSPEIQRVEGTGAPSSRPSSTADNRPAHEVYDRMATELWWSGREVLQAGQLRGLYPEACRQLCARTYEMQRRKYSIETKQDFKGRLGRSCDDADAVIGLVEVARRNGLVIGSVNARADTRSHEARLAHAASLFNDDAKADPIDAVPDGDAVFDTEVVSERDDYSQIGA